MPAAHCLKRVTGCIVTGCLNSSLHSCRRPPAAAERIGVAMLHSSAVLCTHNTQTHIVNSVCATHATQATPSSSCSPQSHTRPIHTTHRCISKHPQAIPSSSCSPQSSPRSCQPTAPRPGPTAMSHVPASSHWLRHPTARLPRAWRTGPSASPPRSWSGERAAWGSCCIGVLPLQKSQLSFFKSTFSSQLFQVNVFKSSFLKSSF